LFIFLYIVKILTIDEFAQFVLYLIVVDLLVVISGFGLASTMLRIEDLEKKIVLNNSLVIITLASFFLAIFFTLGLPYLTKIPGGNYIFLKDYGVIVIVAFIAKSFLSLFRGFLISISDPKRYSKLNIFMEIAFFSSLMLYLLGFIRVEISLLNYVLLSQAFSATLTLIYGFFLISDSLSLDKISVNYISNIVAKSWAYLLKNIVGVFQMEASKIVLSIVSTTTMVGIYSFYLLIVNKMSFFIGIFDKVFIPKIKTLYASRNNSKTKHAHYLVKRVTRFYTYLMLLLLSFIGFIFIFISKNSSLFPFFQQDYLEYLDLFYLIIVSWLLGNFRSFYDVWQYMDKATIGIRLVFAHIIILVLLYYGSLFFYGYFGVYGLIYNQILITILYLFFSLYNYKKFCASLLD
jgi:O-antigen/teichoic acid export membrane protein